MVDSSKPISNSSTRIKFSSIFETIDVSKRRTKIVCTLGQSCNDVEQLVKMIDAGMNVARLDFSQGDHKSNGQLANNLQNALKQRPDKTVALMLETKGPEIRTGGLKDNKPVYFEQGSMVEIFTDFAVEGDSSKIACNYKNLPSTVSIGSQICIGDGQVHLEVYEVNDASVKCKVTHEGQIQERMVLSLPGSIIDLPTINDKDEADIIEFGLKHGIDIVCASFVRSANCIETIRDVLGARGAHVKIVAKIQNQQGLNNYDEILAAADGIMISRTDLAMEIPAEKVFIAQKWMIEKANIAAKPIMTASQVLETMCKKLKPSRTEASDVTCAVLDGTDAIVLQSETSSGANPISCVTVLTKICAEAERCIDYKQTFNDIRLYTTAPLGTAEAIASSSVSTVLDLNIDLIICVTDTGCIARLVSKYRPPVPILACSVVQSVIRNLQTVRGVWGFKIPAYQTSDNVVQMVVKVAKENHLVKSGGKVVVIIAQNEDTPDESNVMKIVDVE